MSGNSNFSRNSLGQVSFSLANGRESPIRIIIRVLVVNSDPLDFLFFLLQLTSHLCTSRLKVVFSGTKRLLFLDLKSKQANNEIPMMNTY